MKKTALTLAFLVARMFTVPMGEGGCDSITAFNDSTIRGVTGGA